MLKISNEFQHLAIVVKSRCCCSCDDAFEWVLFWSERWPMWAHWTHLSTWAWNERCDHITKIPNWIFHWHSLIVLAVTSLLVLQLLFIISCLFIFINGPFQRSHINRANFPLNAIQINFNMLSSNQYSVWMQVSIIFNLNRSKVAEHRKWHG